ncbi:Wzz/FepE/Etk N-terminal domain-containing protein [Streptomyces sp. 7R007]
MDVRAYLRLLRRHRALVLLLTLLGVAAGAAIAWLKPPVYAAKTQLVVASANPGRNATDAYQGSLLATQSAQSYTRLLNSSTVARGLIAQLDLPYTADRLRHEISAVNPAGTSVIAVTVEDHSKQRARTIAAAVGPLFANLVKPGDVTVTVLDPAEPVPGIVSPNRTLYVTSGAVLGLALGLGAAVLREITDSRIRDEADLRAVSGAPLLAVLPRPVADTRPTDLLEGRHPRARAAFRRLGVDLGPGTSDPSSRMYALTSPAGGDAPARLAAALAVTLARGGDRVVVVDADVRHGRLAADLGLVSDGNLTDVLAGRVALDQALEPVRPGLPLLALAGRPNGPELDEVPLRHDRLAVLCERLADRHGVVLFVAPPVLTEADAVVLARVLPRTILVVEAKSTRGEEVTEAERCLEAAGATVVGTVLSGGETRRPWAPSSAPRPARAVDGHLPSGMSVSGEAVR